MFRKLFFIFIFSIFVTKLFSQINNDECVNAIEIPVNIDGTNNLFVNGSVEGASISAQKLSNTTNNTYLRDVWFKFTAKNNIQKITVSNFEGNTTSYDLFLYKSGCDSLGDYLTKYTSTSNYVFANLNVDSTYYLRIGVYGNYYNTFNLSVSNLIYPLNDLFSNAIPLTINSNDSGLVFELGNLENAILGETSRICWYKFVATSNYIKVNVERFNASNSKIGGIALTQTPTNYETNSYLNYKAFPTNSNTMSWLYNDLIVGQTYYIPVIQSNIAGSDYNYKINIGLPNVSSLNDECYSAIDIAEQPNINLQTSNVNFQGSYASSGYLPESNKDVWYKFNANEANLKLIISNFNIPSTPQCTLKVRLYSGDCNNLGTEISIADLKSTSSYNNIALNNLITGNEYYLRFILNNNSNSQVFLDNYNGTFSFKFESFVYDVNDELINAIEIPVNLGADTTNFIQSKFTSNSTNSIQVYDCYNNTNNYKDVWYKFTAQTNYHQLILFDKKLLSNNNSQTVNNLNTYVYKKNPDNSLTNIICNTQNIISFTNLEIGSEYLVRINNSFQQNFLDSFKIAITSVIQPNDEYQNAINLNVNPDLIINQSEHGYFNFASRSTNVSFCSSTTGGIVDVWYKFKATNTKHLINVNNNQRLIANTIYKKVNGSLILFDNYCRIYLSDDSAYLNNLIVDSTYYIRCAFEYYVGDHNMQFDISITTPIDSLPNNDECSNSIVLTNNIDFISNYEHGNLTGSTKSIFSNSTCSPTNRNDIWYKFTASSTSQYLKFINVNQPFYASVYKGTCSSFSSNLICGNNINTSAEMLMNNLVIGQDYFVELYTSNFLYSTSEFDIALLTKSLKPNDNCVGSTTLQVDSYQNFSNGFIDTIRNATSSYTSNFSACNNNSSLSISGPTVKDLWYKFVATSTCNKVTVQNLTNPTQTIKYDIYSGSCNSLSLVNCSNLSYTDLSIGSTYYIHVYSTLTDTSVYKIFVNEFNEEKNSAIYAVMGEANDFSNQISGTFNGACATSVYLACNNSGRKDIWYKFIATAPVAYIQFMNYIGNDLYFTVTNSTGTSLLCNSTLKLGYVTGLTIGSAYYINVSKNSVSANADDFTLRVSKTQNICTNDDSANSTHLVANSDLNCLNFVTSSTLGATFGGYSLPNSSCYIPNGAVTDIWFDFQAQNINHFLKLYNKTNNTPFYYFLYKKNASGGVGSYVTCNQVDSNVILNNLIIGQTYYIRLVYYKMYVATILEQGTFDICLGTMPLVINDEKINAINVISNSETSCNPNLLIHVGDIEYSTKSLPLTACNSNITRDLWYKFKASSTIHTITFQNFQNMSSIGTIILDSNNTQIQCGLNTNNQITGLTVNKTYYLKFYLTDYYNQARSFDFCIGTTPPEMQNTSCISANYLIVNPTNVCDSIYSPNVSIPSNIATWYKFTAKNVNHKVTVTPIYTSPNSFYIYNSCSSGALSANVDGNSKILSNLIIGNEYILQVYGAFQSICITTPDILINDECSGALSLTVSDLNCNNKTSGTITGATNSNYFKNCSNSDDDVWYKFVATQTSHRIAIQNIQSNSAALVNFELYEGNCNNLVLKNMSITGSCVINTENVAENLILGNTYYLRVFSYGTAIENAIFDICLTNQNSTTLPNNDEVSGAILIDHVNGYSCNFPVIGNLENASVSGVPDCYTVNNSNAKDLWYKFTAISSSVHIYSSTISGFVPGLNYQLFSSNGGNLGSRIGCGYTFNLTVGNDYFLRVFQDSPYENYNSNGVFSLCLNSTTDIVSNDYCENAIYLPINNDNNCTKFDQGFFKNSSLSSPMPSCSSGLLNDVWYKFVASDTSHTVSLYNIVNTSNSLQKDLYLSIYHGNCNNLGAEIICSDTDFSTINSLIIGDTYSIRVFSKYTNNMNLSFNICVGKPIIINNSIPINDICFNASEIIINEIGLCDTTYSGTLENATQSPQGFNCYSGINDDVWYRFTATSSNCQIAIFDKNGNQSDLIHELYFGPCGNLGTQVICSDADTSLVQNLIIGHVYYLRVYSKVTTTGSNTKFKICISRLPDSPSNDLCSNAINLPVNLTETCTQSLNGRLSFASKSTLSNACTNVGFQDVWYKFTASNTSQILSLSNIVGTSGALYSSIYSGNCTNLNTPIFCGMVNNMTVSNLSVGNEYLIRIYSPTQLTFQDITYTICLKTIQRPVNDECVNAINLVVINDVSTTPKTPGTLVHATASNQFNSCGGTIDDDDVWYKFTASSTRQRIILSDIAGSIPDLYISVYDSIPCNSNSNSIQCSNFNSTDLNNLTIGEEYYIRVYSLSNYANSVNTFNICVNTPPLIPLNDLCNDAVLLSINQDQSCTLYGNGTLVGSTLDMTYACSSVPVFGGVWYKFIADKTYARVQIIPQNESSLDYYFVVYNGDCSSYSNPILCSDANSGVTGNLVIGNTYLIGVFSKQHLTEAMVSPFEICVSTPPQPPINDLCYNATDLTVNETFDCFAYKQGTLTNSMPSINLNSCSNGGNTSDVWYRFQASRSKHYVKLFGVSGNYTNLYHSVYSGDCFTMFNPLLCSDLDSSQVSGLVPGQYYYIRVSTYNGIYGQTSNFNICITSEPLPINDLCANAISLGIDPNNSDSYKTTGTLQYATNSSFSVPNCSSSNLSLTSKDVWYKFTAVSDSVIISVFDNTYIDYQLFSGNCSSFTTLSNSCNTFNKSNLFSSLIIGQEYLIRCYESSTQGADVSTFEISLRKPGQPSLLNDNQTAAISLVLDSTNNCSQVVYGTVKNATPSISNAREEDDDVWFKFTATSQLQKLLISNINGNAINSLLLDINDLGVYHYPLQNNTVNTFNLSNLIVGGQYYLKFYSNQITKGIDIDFDICLQNTDLVLNDECDSAIVLIPSLDSFCGDTKYSSFKKATASFQDGKQDLWYKFTANSTHQRIHLENLTNLSNQLKYEIYTGSCNNKLLFQSNGMFTQQFIIGQEYLVRIYSNQSSYIADSFKVCVAKSPINEECISASNILVNSNGSCSSIVSGNLFSSTCLNSIGGEVWYKFTATNSSVQVQTTGGGFSYVAIKNGNCNGTLTTIGSSNSAGTFIVNNLTLGQDYFVVVVYNYSPVNINYTLCLQEVGTPPSNDLCTNAIQILTNQDNTCTINKYGVLTYATPSTNLTGDDVWYKFIATSSFTEVSFVNSTGYENCDLYNASCNINSILNPTYFNGNKRYSNLIIGQEYYVRVFRSTSYSTNIASFQLCVKNYTISLPPVNDICYNALPLVVNQNMNCDSIKHVNLANTTSTSFSNACYNTSSYKDVWYKFIATKQSHILSKNNVVGAYSSDINLTVFQGNCSGTALNCGNTNANEINLDNLTIGSVYYVRAYSTNSSSIQQFDLCVKTFTAPNDECTGAISLIVNSNNNCSNYITINNQNGTISNNLLPCQITSGKVDVWYKFTATSLIHEVKLFGLSTNTNVGMEVFKGNCTSIDSSLACENGLSNQILNNLSIGEEYYVRVFAPINVNGLYLCVSTIVSPPTCSNNTPAGNTCSTALSLCNLDGYCGKTSGYYTVDTWHELDTTFCGTLENNSFLSFVPETDNINFNVWVTSTISGKGIQIFIFDADNCQGEVTPYLCWDPNFVPSGATFLSASGLTPGKKYYMMIDGQDGDICDYVFSSSSPLISQVNSNMNNETVCLGDSLLLSFSGGDGNYFWDPTSDFNVVSTDSIYFVPTNLGTFSHQINSFYNNNVCSQENILSLNFEVIECVCPVLASTNSDSCVSHDFDLFASNVQGASYSWSGPNGFSSNIQNPSNILSPTSAGIFEYIVIATRGSQTCSDTVNLIVNQLENPDFTYNGHDFCLSNDSIVPVVLGDIGGSFELVNSVNSNINTTNGVINLTNLNSGLRYVKYQTNGNCPQSLIKEIELFDTPTINDVSDQIICNGNVFPAIIFNGQNSNLFNWYNINNHIGLADSGQNIIPSFGTNPQTSIDSIEIIIYPYSLGCGLGNSDTFNYIINPVTEIVITPIPNLCLNYSPINLYDFVQPVGGQFYWNSNNDSIFSPQIAGVGTTNINYSFNNQYSCASSESITVVVDECLGVNELDNDLISIYPNPTHDKLYINLPNKCEFKLIDNTGRILSDGILGLGINELNFNEFIHGIYTIKLIFDENEVNYKIVFE